MLHATVTGSQSLLLQTTGSAWVATCVRTLSGHVTLIYGGRHLQHWPNTMMTVVLQHRSSECLHSLLYISQIHIDQGE